MQEAFYYNAINIYCAGDYKKLSSLKQKYGNWQEAWEAVSRAKNTDINPEKELEKIEKLGIQIITESDAQYPPLLKEIPLRPFGIYVLGKLHDYKTHILGIIGTRKATIEGKILAKKFAVALAERGIVIVSGLALGIDAAAHEGSLSAGGQTIAVLGNGLDYFYPRTNENLARKILAHGGAIISEYHLGAPPLPYRFLERNRIVSGLSRGVLVIEAPKESGSLATARFALDQNRDVFVIPGPITHPNYIGSNQLIRAGAELITKPDDILEAFGIEVNELSPKELTNPKEKIIFEAIKKFSQPINVDKIRELTNLNIADLNTALTFMVLKGAIDETGAGYTINQS